jgi:DNA-3-methyladenine glycosylase I
MKDCKMAEEHSRCVWAEGDALMTSYHDQEWAVPQHDSRMLWEMLMLTGFQAGLAWIIVLRKRGAFRRAFAGFDPAIVASFGEEDVARLMADPGIVRAQAKIRATSRARGSIATWPRVARALPTTAGHSPMASGSRAAAENGSPTRHFRRK